MYLGRSRRLIFISAKRPGQIDKSCVGGSAQASHGLTDYGDITLYANCNCIVESMIRRPCNTLVAALTVFLTPSGLGKCRLAVCPICCRQGFCVGETTGENGILQQAFVGQQHSLGDKNNGTLKSRTYSCIRRAAFPLSCFHVSDTSPRPYLQHHMTD